MAELVTIDINQEKTPSTDIKTDIDYYVLNSKSSLVLYLQEIKSKNFKVNNIVKLIEYDIESEVVSSGLSENFSKTEYKDEKLQIYVMIELFILPKLINENK